jgi:hypothetical protein
MDLRRSITRAEFEHAFSGGAAGLYCAAIFDNPNIASDDLFAANDRLHVELHALMCAMLLMTNASQNGVPAVIERDGREKRFSEGISLLDWPELSDRLGKFLALMEPYTLDEKWWDRLTRLEEAGAFKEFEDWFWANESELERRVEDFVRKNESALFIFTD